MKQAQCKNSVLPFLVFWDCRLVFPSEDLLVFWYMFPSFAVILGVWHYRRDRKSLFFSKFLVFYQTKEKENPPYSQVWTHTNLVQMKFECPRKPLKFCCLKKLAFYFLRLFFNFPIEVHRGRGQNFPRLIPSLKTLTSLNKESRPFFRGDRLVRQFNEEVQASQWTAGLCKLKSCCPHPLPEKSALIKA